MKHSSKRAVLVILAALILWPSALSAHDVPDDVRIVAYLKPENGKMLILVRFPANALIDFIFPTQGDTNWLDLEQIGGLPTQGANVWIADLLSLYEGKDALARPDVIKARLSRADDSSFNTFQDAYSHVNAEPLPTDTLVTQDTAMVDALLETPIQSVNSDFSFEPRFAHVGVRVTTALTFLPAEGGVRQFQYEGDLETFELNPKWDSALIHFVKEGFTHYLSETDYLLFLLCVAIAFLRFPALGPFFVVFTVSETCALIYSAIIQPAAFWIPVLCGILIAAATVYMGIESILASPGGGRRLPLAVATGVIFGSGFWFGLQPVIQFGGSHHMVSALGFNAGIIIAEICAVALILAAAQGLVRSSAAPRVIVIIAAAIAIHISWHRMLDRAQQFSLVSSTFPVISPSEYILAGTIAAVALLALAYRQARKTRLAAGHGPHDSSIHPQAA